MRLSPGIPAEDKAARQSTFYPRTLSLSVRQVRWKDHDFRVITGFPKETDLIVSFIPKRNAD